MLDLPTPRHLLDDELRVHPDLDIGRRVEAKGTFETGEQTGILSDVVAGQPQGFSALQKDRSGVRVAHQRAEAGHPGVAA